MKKEYTKTGRSCKVTFECSPADAQEVVLLGDFNGWNSTETPMKRRKDGSFSATVSLKPGTEYRFRYLADGQTWLNDTAADKFVPNSFGTEDSVVSI
ncbi:MAG TPA: isoamylase early set domain-containing protein [Anaerolineales bacterium]|nr:isoamylase early set domain-containing protein [Anaerolineales bacterium]